MNCPGSVMASEKQDCLAYPLARSSMVFLQLHIFTYIKAELSTCFFFLPLFFLEHSKTVHKIYNMGLPLHFLPSLLPLSELPASQ